MVLGECLRIVVRFRECTPLSIHRKNPQGYSGLIFFWGVGGVKTFNFNISGGGGLGKNDNFGGLEIFVDIFGGSLLILTIFLNGLFLLNCFL